jgi:hypothetical protein
LQALLAWAFSLVSAQASGYFQFFLHSGVGVEYFDHTNTMKIGVAY